MAWSAPEAAVPLTLAPLHQVQPSILEFLAWTLNEEGLFRAAVGGVVLDPQPAWDAKRNQFNGLVLLEALEALSPAPGHRVLGVFGGDLFLPVMTHVYGAAQTGGRAAIFSYHRLHPEFYGMPSDEGLLLARCLKEAMHELGHALGLVHCPDHACAMSYSSSIEAVDLKGDAYCAVCSEQARSAERGRPGP